MYFFAFLKLASLDLLRPSQPSEPVSRIINSPSVMEMIIIAMIVFSICKCAPKYGARKEFYTQDIFLTIADVSF